MLWRPIVDTVVFQLFDQSELDLVLPAFTVYKASSRDVRHKVLKIPGALVQKDSSATSAAYNRYKRSQKRPKIR
jgi:hypothetical protein